MDMKKYLHIENLGSLNASFFLFSVFLCSVNKEKMKRKNIAIFGENKM